MRKRIFTMLALLVMAVTGAWAEDTYTITAKVGDNTAILSETATLPYESTLAGCYQAATGSAPSPVLTVTAASVSSGDNVTLGTLNGWDTTLSVTGEGSATIAMTATMIGNVSVTINCTKNASADPDPSVAEVTPTGNKNEWQFTMPDFSVVAKIEYDNLALDEEADNVTTLDEWDGYEADVTLNRTLLSGSWNTFAAPFDFSDAQIAGINALLQTSGSSLKIKELESSELSDDKLILNFKDATSIEAGKPYLVKVPTDFSLTSIPFKDAEVSKEPVTIESEVVDFVPTLGKTLVTGPGDDPSNKDAVLFLTANNTLKNPTVVNNQESSESYIKGFRAYFQVKGQAKMARSFSLNFGDGEQTTGIIGVTANTNRTNQTDVYDLQGRKVEKATKGVYIQNGRKVIK